MSIKSVVIVCLVAMIPFAVSGQTIKPGRIWKDNRGIHINAHGGCVISHGGKYYWYGEHKSDDTSSAMVGVTCYSSENLVDWTYEGVALPVSDEAGHDIERGCILERPKVVYNEATRRFVMWFHLNHGKEHHKSAPFLLVLNELRHEYPCSGNGQGRKNGIILFPVFSRFFP